MMGRCGLSDVDSDDGGDDAEDGDDDDCDDGGDALLMMNRGQGATQTPLG